MVAHYRQHVGSLDLRGQCGRSDGASSIHSFLPDLRVRSGGDAYLDPARLDRSNCGRLRRNRGRTGGVLTSIPDGATSGDVSSVVPAVLLRAAGRALFGVLVFPTVVQRRICIGRSSLGRRHRLVGTCGWVYGRAGALSAVHLEAMSVQAASTR